MEETRERKRNSKGKAKKKVKRTGIYSGVRRNIEQSYKSKVYTGEREGDGQPSQQATGLFGRLLTILSLCPKGILFLSINKLFSAKN